MKYTLVSIRISVLMSLACATASVAQHSVATSDRSIAERRTFEILLSHPVTASINNVSLRRAIDIVAASARVPVQYQSEIVAGNGGLVSLHVTGVSLRSALDQLLAGTKLRVIPDGMSRVMIVEDESISSPSTQAVISGTITDAKTGQPLRGVTVMLDDATRGVTTGDDGVYRLLSVV